MAEDPMQTKNQYLTRGQFLNRAVVMAGGLAGSGLARIWPDAPLFAAAPLSTVPQRVPTGKLTVSLPNRIVALDPMGATAAEPAVRTVAAHIFDPLVSFDPHTRKYIPALAVKWETPDPTTWLFSLRPGAKFHNGSPLTARDVKASLDRIMTQAGPFVPLWSPVSTVETPSDTTLRIKTRTPMGTMLASLSLLSILPADRMTGPGFFDRPIGSGPFRVASYQPGAGLVLDANPNYWGTLAGVKTLEFREIPELAARVTALITGEIDLTYEFPPEQVASLGHRNDIRLLTVPSYEYYFIWTNLKRTPFTDKRVRQAMVTALDINTMLKTLLQGIARPMNAPFPSTVFGYTPQRPAYVYNPGQAKQLLAAAGYPNGFEATMIWNPGSGPQDREIAQALFSYWSAIGVRIKDAQSERGEWIARLNRLDWDVDLQTNFVITGDADYVLRRLYTTQANRQGYANPQFDQVVNTAAQTVGELQRKLLYAQASAKIWEDIAGIFPFELLQVYAHRQNVRGFLPSPSFPTFTSVTIQK
jgi:peptide/nickel transport system substrate-binding protein